MPILTHPERNPILQQSPQRILEWAEQGCLIQVTGSALTGLWGERPEIVSRWLLDRAAVHILSSDAHDTRSAAFRIFPRLAPWLRKLSEPNTPMRWYRAIQERSSTERRYLSARGR